MTPAVRAQAVMEVLRLGEAMLFAEARLVVQTSRATDDAAASDGMG
jgi:hypothetical protein